MAHRKPANRELRLTGTVASGGLVAGQVVCLDRPDGTQQPAPVQTPAQEKTVLDRAVSAAVSDLRALVAGLDDEEAAGIVEFQIAMLEDETVVEPAHGAIRTGTAAAPAWAVAMAGLIDDYETASDDYFRARTADLADIRDRVMRHLGAMRETPIRPGSVVICDNLAPTRFLETDWSGSGIVLYAGSACAHVAMLARSRGTAMLVGVGHGDHPRGGVALIDTENRCVIFNPGATTVNDFERRRAAGLARAQADRRFLDRPAKTADGTRVEVHLNISQPEELDSLDPAHCDGIGLVRTEFLFRGERLPDEETQLACYARMVKWAGGRPVTIRTLDAGGDKPVAGLTLEGESNPFLGVRGFRLSRRHEKIFKTQLRALLRAAALGPVGIMIPMITVPQEMDAARRLLNEARGELAVRGVSYGNTALGMMVEVPAAALCIDRFTADFYSIGSNDLAQYVMACGRDNPHLDELMEGHPGVLRELVERVCAHAGASGRQASICGDMAGDRQAIPMLLEAGLRCLSVPPAALAPTKAAIARHGGRKSGAGADD